MTLDKRTNLPSSIIAVYPYQGKYYGRIIATYSKQGVLEETIYYPRSRAKGVCGNPYYCGLDFAWVSHCDGRGTYKGYVVDPRDGNIYNAKFWKENGKLILRGELLMFGRNETLPPFPIQNFNASFPQPDLSTFVPYIYRTNK